jgi:hypothetical protein
MNDFTKNSTTTSVGEPAQVPEKRADLPITRLMTHGVYVCLLAGLWFFPFLILAFALIANRRDRVRGTALEPHLERQQSLLRLAVIATLLFFVDQLAVEEFPTMLRIFRISAAVISVWVAIRALSSWYALLHPSPIATRGDVSLPAGNHAPTPPGTRITNGGEGTAYSLAMVVGLVIHGGLLMAMYQESKGLTGQGDGYVGVALAAQWMVILLVAVVAYPVVLGLYRKSLPANASNGQGSDTTRTYQWLKWAAAIMVLIHVVSPAIP